MRYLQSGATADVYWSDDWEGGEQLGFVEGDFAIKVHRSDCTHAKEESKRELAALRRLEETGHATRFVVKLHFVDSLSAALPIFGLEFCGGGDLFGLLRYGPLSEKDTKYYAAEIAIALTHLHAANIFHSDLKPENVGISGTGHVRIFDFGSARILLDDEPISHCSGTLLYASPEAITRKPCGYAADWWSFGVIVFEMMFGVEAFAGESQDETVSAIVDAEPQWPSSPWRSPAAELFVRDILKVDPESRLQSLQACVDHPFWADVDLDLVTSETWVPLKFNYISFEQEKEAEQAEHGAPTKRKPRTFF